MEDSADDGGFSPRPRVWNASWSIFGSTGAGEPAWLPAARRPARTAMATAHWIRTSRRTTDRPPESWRNPEVFVDHHDAARFGHGLEKRRIMAGGSGLQSRMAEVAERQTHTA